MTRPLAALLFAAFSALATAACNGETPPPTQLAAVPACPESQETGCENGKPLCAPDNGGTCLMCRCTEYSRFPVDSAAFDPRRGMFAGSPGAYAYRP